MYRGDRRQKPRLICRVRPDISSFATGIRIDKEAVLNGLTLPCSSGRVEGIVNKVKAVKRQMYGRASFTLLRKRIILHPA